MQSLFYGGDKSPRFRYGTRETEGSAKIPPIGRRLSKGLVPSAYALG